MQFKSDTEIKKWRPKGNNTRVRCGPKLYVRGFETGRKLFQLRFEVSRKTNWLDVADYPAMSLAVAGTVASDQVMITSPDLLASLGPSFKYEYEYEYVAQICL